jgi:recombinational DNA repair ATPase RecF
MAVKELTLEHFTAFEATSLTFSPAINILIGANSTGKTYVLKVIYSLVKACEAARRQPKLNGNVAELFGNKLPIITP